MMPAPIADAPERILVIACGALARELVRIKQVNHWHYLDIQCLPADYHNHPHKIVPAVRRKIAENRAHYRTIFIGYADCGTGGQLGKLAAEENVERLPGAHCYSFLAGAKKFEALADAEIGTFYLTDYLAKNFDRLIIKGFGIDRHPELKDMVFANYKKLVYLAQTTDPAIDRCAEQAAADLGLKYARIQTGDAPFAAALSQSIDRASVKIAAPTPHHASNAA